jgi:surface protein
MSISKKDCKFYLTDDDIDDFDHFVVTRDNGNFRDYYKNFLEKKNKEMFALANLDVSKVTSMTHMFNGAESFNQPIGNWNVSKVTGMAYMFAGALKFNQPIGNWNVSNVTSMAYMFDSAQSFNQPIGNWNVSNVTNMQYMFYKAKSFNQDISKWDVRKVTDIRRIGFYIPLKPLVAYSVYQWYLDKKITKKNAEEIFGGAAKLKEYYEKEYQQAVMFKGNVALSNRVKRNMMKYSKTTGTKFKRLTKSTFSKNPKHKGDLDATLKALNHEPIFDKIMGYAVPTETKKRKSASKSPKNKRQTRSASKPKSANQTRSASKPKSANQTRSAKSAKSI